MITFPLDALDAIDPMAGLKRAKRIASHTSFFKTGTCVGRTFVCVVKTSPLSSTIKILEPIDQNVRGRSKPTFRKLLQGGNDTLRIFKVRPASCVVRAPCCVGTGADESRACVRAAGRSSTSPCSRARSTSSRRSYASRA